MPWWYDDEPEIREAWLQAQREVPEIEAGNFICPWCQRYVDPAQWWTHIAANPYQERRNAEWDFPTLFHRGCAAHIPEHNVKWVRELRSHFRDLPVKPGDYVRLKRRFKPFPVEALFRVIDIEIDPHVGVTYDDPYYEIDISEPGHTYEERASVRRSDIEAIERPYLKSQESN